MATVRAKFQVTRVECSTYSKSVKREDGSFGLEKQEMRTIVLSPVYSEAPDSENKRFWDSSPTGEIRLGTVNPAAWQAFDLDKAYYIDFTPAE